MVRCPPVLRELASVPRTTASRPFRHSPEETNWSASWTKRASSEWESCRSRAFIYFWTISRMGASSGVGCAAICRVIKNTNNRAAKKKTNRERIGQPPGRERFGGDQSTAKGWLQLTVAIDGRILRASETEIAF